MCDGSEMTTAEVSTPVKRTPAPGMAAEEPRSPPDIKAAHRRWKVMRGRRFEERLFPSKSGRVEKASPKKSGTMAARPRVLTSLYARLQRVKEASPWDCYYGQVVVEECQEEMESESSDLGTQDSDASDTITTPTSAVSVEDVFRRGVQKRLDQLFEDPDTLGEESTCL